ncbi:phosphoribosylaminoimidazolecarboxamide formyltransferase [Archaeoglobus veneficus]|uniref:Phosphoribosylaminoimidazolecarboxamide formyltransferase n=1 Tax=Archaeoglobus veneficus (strain DSM 11195 / SNP6) TaxID=693661 RepID=F2KS36_ARCVS|nr:phosphoribosylaminoimidazolecarboxamide formyltransferase [Archaeoglobus veneficus]AEA47975.1 Phosphoribosylaminoimidazolecarboxamide formyltransferase [Archaeoglobus veneficus SNP6]
MRALISVSNKEGVAEFTAKLEEMGIEIFATEGTARSLEERGVRVRRLSELTGLKETHQLKTLHPAIYEAIFSGEIGMVVVNLYPFEEEPCIENIDIGGVTLLRAAAKNYRRCLAVSKPEQYDDVIKNLKEGLTEEFRLKLASEAFEYVAAYDKAIAEWFRTKSSVA